MAVAYAQGTRPFTVQTPAGADVLLLMSLKGREAVSELFEFDLELIAENAKTIAFDKLLGQKITVTFALPGGKKRYLSGICKSFSQGERDATFTTYRMEMVPRLWLLTKKSQCRIFQHISVPDILKKVFEGLDVSYELQGSFEKRDYCVQYRESDYNFASRLMEEEGIFYYFKHTADGHKMVVSNTSASNPALADFPSIEFEPMEGGSREKATIKTWRKTQEVKSGKVTLWDHCFEFPGQNLQAQTSVAGSVSAGKASHPLAVANNAQLEIYDYPGAYAQRFDGIDAGGGEQPSEVSKIFKDNTRTVGLRMQEETAGALLGQGTSDCRHLSAGFKFSLAKHYSGDGDYLITAVEHNVSSNAYRSGDDTFRYVNQFTAIPFAQPYRPARKHGKPAVAGSQTATVVGPAGEEIFTDKFGRIKVQMNWDRDGKKDANSSCWVRVGTPWAGKQWGMIHIPRIGQEVIVDFLEGDPDQPICVGSVYNSEQMPPYKLPDNKTQSGIKSRSSLKGTPENFNEFRFEDKKGEEEVYLHAEKNLTIVVENDEAHSVGHDRKKSITHDETTTVGHDRTETVGNNESIQIGKDRTEQVGKNETVSIGDNRNFTVGKNDTLKVSGAQSIAVTKDMSLTVEAAQTVSVKKSQSVEVGGSRSTNVKESDTVSVTKNVSITAGDQIVLKSGDASITLKKNGDILISGKDIKVTASGKINVEASGDMTLKGSKIKAN